MTLTQEAWEALAKIREDVAAIKATLEAHCREEDARRTRIAPWVSNFVAIAALAVALVAVLAK